MITIYILSGTVTAILILYILATACRRGHKGLSGLQGWAYAHRGLHGDGVPENSTEAFRLAVNAGYGSELDIHLLADNNLAVIHDSLLIRTTGATGRIEDLTVKDLDSYTLEGTAYKIPTFEQVLAIYSGKAPLIVELKPENNNHAALCQRVCDVLDGYNGIYCVESFDPRCIRWFRKNRPDIIRGQLSENFLKTKNSKLPWIIKVVMKLQLLNFWTRPDFIAYKFRDRKSLGNFLCRRLWGAQGVSWTIINQQEFTIAKDEGWIPIFEGFKP